MKSLIFVVIPAFLFGFWIPITADGEEFDFRYQKQIEAESPLRLDLTLTHGSVRVTGDSPDGVVIEAVKRVRATNREEAEEVADHIEIRADVAPGKITVSTNFLKMLNHSPSLWRKLFGSGCDSYGSVDYTVSVPTNTTVGVTMVSGDVALSGLEGDIVVENSSGKTVGEFLFGSVTIVQQAGVVDLRWIEGDIRIRSQTGEVSIQQERGAVDVSTQSGDVTVRTELDSWKDYFVETTSGGISFAIPEMSSGTLQVQSQTGRVRTDVPVAVTSVLRNGLVGEFGGGGSKIRLVSSSGDVNVAQF